MSGFFGAGGVAGGFLGVRAARRLSARKGTPNRLLAALALVAASCIVWRPANQAESRQRQLG